MRFNLLICLSLFCLPIQLLAQKKQAFNVKTFTEQSGLDDKGPFTMVKSDRDGFIWVLSYRNIYRYDGQSFNEIDVSGARNVIFLSFFETAENKKFVIGLNGGIYFINGDTLAPYQYNSVLKEISKRQVYNDVYFDKRNRLHISYNNRGYCVIDEGKVTYPLKEKGYKLKGFVCVLREGDMPFLAIHSDTIFPDRKERHYYLFDSDLNLIEERKAEKVDFTHVPEVTKRANGNFIASSGYGNLLEFNTTGFVKEYEYELPIFNLFMDKDEGLWVSTIDGLYFYPNADLTQTATAAVYEGQFAYTNAQDYEGGIWFFTQKSVGYISRPNQRFFNKANGWMNSDRVRGVAYSKNKLYSITDIPGSIVVTDLNEGMQDRIVLDAWLPEQDKRYAITRFTDIQIDQATNNIWVANRGNILYGKNNQWSKLSMDGIIPAKQHAIYQFSRENYRKGCAVAGFSKDWFFLVEKDSVSYCSAPFSKSILELLVLQDTILICTSNGVYQQVGDSTIFLGDQFPELKSSIHTLTYFAGKIWFSIADKGLFVLDDGKLNAVTYNGIALTSTALFVHKDSSQLWVLNRQGSFKISRNKEIVLGSTPYIQASGRSGVAYSEGVIYQGTKAKGIGSVSIEQLRGDALQTPRLFFTRLKINGKQIVPTDSVFELSYDQSFIQISYIGLSYRTRKVEYRHRLLGLQQDWIETEEDYLQFTTLPVGQYTFELQCRVSGQPWSKSKKLQFIIHPPYWKTGWFISLVVIMVVTLTYLGISIRFRRLKKERDLTIAGLQAEQRALRAQMNPHFIFNIVASIRYMVNQEKPERVNQFLDLFSSSMRNVLRQANESSISIENEIQFLKNYIDLQQFRMENSFEYTLEYESIIGILEQRIPPFVIQPFVENSIQHGLKNKVGSGQLSLTFKVQQPYLEVTILDNGMGREKGSLYQPGKNKKSYGIKLIREQLSLHNGTKDNVVIEDRLDENNRTAGTRVVVRIRLVEALKETS